jgi:signal transduction histidine kinase
MHGPGPRRDARSTLVAVVAAGTADIDKQLSFLAVLLVATAVGTMAVSGGVAWLVVSRGLRPLVTVAGEIAALDETGLKNRIADRHVPREIEPVVHQLNALLGRLDEAFDRERSLTADVAHELRTPVAEIRTIADITLSRSREPDAYCQALGDIADTTKALQGLIEKLLVLARLEAGHVKPEMESVPLKSAIVEQWALVHPTAKAKGITLDDRCGPEVLVAADPQLLDMAVGNALSNAADYAANGSTVIVEAKRGEARCELSVANSGCRLSNSEVALVFERFWRADAARSRSGLHCGLGLTLVRRAMEAMGGKADAAVDGGDWFILTLTFPAA